MDSDSIFNASKPPPPLTPEAFFTAMERIRNQPPPAPHGTPGNPHIVHPDTHRRGYGHCVECGAFLTDANPN